MVRSYKRTTTRAEYSIDVLRECLHAVQAKALSLREASRHYGIPRSTIQKRLKSADFDQAKSLGRFKRALSDEMEMQLKRRVLEMESAFYGITVTDLRRAAYAFAEGNNINHPFNRSSRLAGKDWVLDFARRHRLSVRTPQSTSMNRVLAFEKEKVERYFTLLKSVYDQHKIPPHRVYNLDESGITSVPKPGKILALTGRKQVGRIASGEKGRTVTVVAAINAAGGFIPPVMIFPRKRMNDRLLTDAVPGTIGYVSGNGWIDSSLFVAYLDHFIHYSNATKENKVLLILDNHVSHKSIEAIDKANDNGIVLLTLPPHTSSKLQPLDRSVFRSLKINYSQECDRWMTNHHGRKITEYDMAAILKPAFLKAMSPANIISGFNSTGIFPYNPDVITDDDYAAADAARGIDRQLIADNLDHTASQAVALAPTITVPSSSAVIDLPTTTLQNPTASNIIDLLATSSSTDSPPSDAVGLQLNPAITVSHASAIDPLSAPITTMTSDSVPSTSATSNLISLDIVSPVHTHTKCSQPKTQKRSAQQADIVTGSPYKKQLIEKQAAKEKKEALAEQKRLGAENKSEKGKGKQAKSVKINRATKKQKACRPSVEGIEAGDDSDCECLYCPGLFMNSSDEDWIQCSQCKRWSHERCTDYSGVSGYTCDFCRN